MTSSLSSDTSNEAVRSRVASLSVPVDTHAVFHAAFCILHVHSYCYKLSVLSKSLMYLVFPRDADLTFSSLTSSMPNHNPCTFSQCHFGLAAIRGETFFDASLRKDWHQRQK